MHDSKCSLLIVDDESTLLSTLHNLFKRDYEVFSATTAEEAIAILTSRDIHIVLCDQRLPGMSGVQLMEWAHENRPKTMRIMMTGYADLDGVVQAINRGHVYRFLFKPWRVEEVQQVIKDAAELFRLERNNQRLVVELQRLNEQLEQRVELRTEELESRTEELHRTNLELEQKNRMLERLALTDELTGLPNRRAIDGMLQAEVVRRMRYAGGPLCVGYVDVDLFKDVNTNFTHAGGDAALNGVGRTLLACIRAVDVIGRHGGDEFFLIAPHTDHTGAVQLGERIRAAIEEMEVRYYELRIKLSVSVGLVVAEQGYYPSTDQLKHEAGVALHEAKERGGNSVVVRPFDLSTQPNEPSLASAS